MKRLIIAIAVISIIFIRCTTEKTKRSIISLNGKWEIEQSADTDIPAEFKHSIYVPSLADMATPSFDSTGYKSLQRNYFWYKRKFVLTNPLPSIAIIKVSKAAFGTQVYINGEFAGENLYNFTPAYIDIRKFLKENGDPNEIIIRIGAFHDVLPDTIQWGHDFEKIRYIPGIYDDVQLILTNPPYIKNIQIAPDITGKIRMVASLQTEVKQEGSLNYIIKEAVSGKTVCKVKTHSKTFSQKQIDSIDYTAKIPNPHLWSPEDPFLYELQASTAGDDMKIRFGVRTFRFDTLSKYAILNGKTYFMRGTNVCIFRFFEDPMRNDLPWNNEWVKKLHEKYKSMHWNSARYCIGFPPELWYGIADELGFLIQDEFPIWNHDDNNLKEKYITPEYKRWMQERWNHPSVVIWDAQNETITFETGKAINKVRKDDFSNRPWDNGWSAPASSEDCMETHPYLFQKYWKEKPSFQGPLYDNCDTIVIPFHGPSNKTLFNKKVFENPNIINEYEWLWINRDGSPTTLTDSVYTNCYGTNLSTGQRRMICARDQGAITEYWRCHRKNAGVLHFCGLGYSRSTEPRGQTSDNWIDVKNLIFEPYFEKYMKSAFSPVGIMINRWESKLHPSDTIKVPVYLINDLYKPWSGLLLLSLIKDNKPVKEFRQQVTINALGRQIFDFRMVLPDETGSYQLIAEINVNNERVQSLRNFEIIE